MSLSKIHQRLLPKMGKFAGFELPLTFQKFNTNNVVTNTRRPGFTTVFDVSHMGIYESQINFSQSKLEELLHLDLNKLKKNKSKLAVLINDKGYVIDDLIISNVEDQKFRLVTNANTPFFNDKEYLQSKEKSIIALQGKGSQLLLEKITNQSLKDLYFMENRSIVSNRFEICRCGYTGEDGFELYLCDKYAPEVYNHLVSLSESTPSVLFGGLIERDILRTEAGLNLAGSEFNDSMKIKFKALNMDFLIDKKFRNDSKFESDIRKILFSSEKPIKRGQIFVKSNTDQDIDLGFITSTVKSFNLDKFIGMGYINKDLFDYINRSQIKNDIIYTKDRKNNNYYLDVYNQFIKPKYYRR
jgi:aminomethyltransferase